MMRIPGLLFATLLAAAPLWAQTTYYVDASCATPGDGTSPICAGGATDPWDEISDITGESAGDTISLKRGEVWRETLTVGSSGSSGSPIIFNAYGTGANPVISGADVMTGFTQVTGSSLYSKDFDDDANWGSVTAETYAALSGTHGGEADGTGWVISSATDFSNGGALTYMEFKMRMVDATASVDGNDWIMRLDDNGVLSHLCVVYVDIDSGQLSLQLRYIAAQSANYSSKVNINEDQTYTVGVLFYSATGTDGWVQMFLDGENVLDITGINSAQADTSIYDLDRLYGGKGNDGTATWTAFTVYLDDILIADNIALEGIYEKASVTTEPQLVVENDVLLTLGSSATALTSGEWFWGSDTLTVRSSDDADPDTHTIEVGQRTYCIYADQKDYITVDGLTLRHANDPAGSTRGALTISDQAEATTTGWTVTNNLIYESAGSGVFFYAGIGELHDTSVEDNVIHDNGVSGIRAEWVDGAEGSENNASRNTIYNHPNLGIQLIANYWLVEENIVYGNGASAGGGIGLANFDESGGYGANSVIRYNHVYDNNGSGNDGSGIYLDAQSSDLEVYGNVVHGNWGTGLDVHSTTNSVVYNNVVYGNNQGSPTGHKGEIRVIEDGTHESANVTIKNNIAVATTSGAFAVYVDALSADSVNLNITSNMWYRASGDWFCYDGTGLSCSGGETGTDVADWNDNAGVGDDFNDEPMFAAPDDDFSLQSGSPAIDAGEDLGSSYDDALLPGSDWPNNVFTALQDDFGAGWEIGAYVWRQTGIRRRVIRR